jgi:hypothetical protein
MSDQSQVIPVARRLLGLGAFRGAATVLFNAAVQRQAAQVHDLRQWTPDGPRPIRRKAEKHLHAANDHDRASKPSATIA